MAKAFTDHEKENIKSKLLIQCEKNWAKYGYKKTNIDDICSKVGISKGAFYLFFKSKESIFAETLCMVQHNLYIMVEEIIKKHPNKQGFTEALKKVYSEYNKKFLICDTKSSDFLAFTNKLSIEEINALEKSSRYGAKNLLDKPYLHFLIDKNIVISIIVSLLSIVSIKDKLAYDHFEVFNFMIDNLVDKIIE